MEFPISHADEIMGSRLCIYVTCSVTGLLMLDSGKNNRDSIYLTLFHAVITNDVFILYLL